MSARRWLAVDAGTTLVKAAAFDESMATVADASVAVPVATPAPGWVEQDPLAMLQAVVEAAERVVAAVYRDDGQIVAAALSNQGESVVAWDASTGAPLYPVVVWQDRRTEAWCSERATPETVAWLGGLTGLPLDPYFSASKMRWLVDHVPAVAEAAHRGTLMLTTTDAFLLWHLSGGRILATDVATASRTGLFSLTSSEWDQSLCRFYGVDPAWLPPAVLPNTAAFGDVRLGGRTFALAAACVDQQAALFGHDARRPGDAKVTYGTGAFVLGQLGTAPRLAPERVLTTIAWDVGAGRHFAFDGGVFTAGAAIDWAVRLGLADSAPATGEAAFAATAADVVFVPALQGLGAPFFDGRARGTLFGLDLATGRNDIVRAVLDGVAFRVADIVRAMDEAGMRVGRVRADGGAANNYYLMQRQADLIGVTARAM